jgi:hypothetical protein
MPRLYARIFLQTKAAPKGGFFTSAVIFVIA